MKDKSTRRTPFALRLVARLQIAPKYQMSVEAAHPNCNRHPRAKRGPRAAAPVLSLLGSSLRWNDVWGRPPCVGKHG